MMGLVTIKAGQRAAIWDKAGRMQIVDGPRRLFLFRQTIQWLERFSAESDEYLAIRYVDGHVENLPGPSNVWFDPVRHQQVEVKQATAIDAHEALIVYRQEEQNVTRRVVRGPAMFVPMANEWLHGFSWHGADPGNPRIKRPHVLKFTRLRVVPDQLYFDVQDVRTADDALLTIKVMVFFELVDIEKMLDQTHDPIADFINALSADVIDFVAVRSFDASKAQTEKFNELETYANLTGRAERIGYRISKVVYRGYEASQKLQMMHDNAIETRTGLHLQAETEQQAQELADLKLLRDAQRAEQKRVMELAAAEHETRVKRMAHEETLRQKEAEQRRLREDERKMAEMRLAQKSAEAARARDDERLLGEIRVARKQAMNREKTVLLDAMKGMQVDLTRYLVAQYQHPDRLIRIDGVARPQVHLQGA